MLNLFKYMYYRVARVVKQFGVWGEKYSDAYAISYISICLIINALLIVIITLYGLLGIHPTYSFRFFFEFLAIPLVILLAFTLPFDDNGE